MFIEALITIDKIWKQYKYPVNRQMDKEVIYINKYIYTHVYMHIHTYR